MYLRNNDNKDDLAFSNLLNSLLSPLLSVTSVGNTQKWRSISAKQKVTAIISQLPTEDWHLSIGDNTLADAILDRLMRNAHRIKLKGESMKKNK